MPPMTIDTGNTAFMLLCSSLVMLMTPGLAFFYGGLVGRKNVLAIMIQSFVSMGWTTVLWWAFGFSLCFSGDLKSGTDFYGILGNFNWTFLRGITLDTPSLINPSIPMLVFCAYQMMFAIITPALITGAFANRVTFKAYMLFLTGWLALVYFPFVHMVWGGGIMASWGVLDFAGGIVVHNLAGFAAIAWLCMDWMTTKKPKFLGLLTGAVAGLATITPAAGYVSPATACLIGIVSGLVCFYAVALKNKMKWDDALDVWGVHGVGGFLGIVLCGIFATTLFNPAGADGLLRGNSHFFLVQLAAVLISSVWAFVFTYGMLWLIDRIVAVKVDEAGETKGLDLALHGETAYVESI